MQNSWVLFHGFVSPVIAVMIIIFNSIGIYKMVKPKSRVRPITVNEKTNNTRLQTIERPLQKFQDAVNETEKSIENGKTEEQLTNKNEAIKSIISSKKRKIAKSFVLLINLAISDLVVGIDIILAKLLFFITMKIKNKALLYALAFFRSCLLPISLTMSITNLLILAILRFYAVSRPLKYMTITRKFLAKICILQWVLITLSVVFHFAFSYRINDKNAAFSYDQVTYNLIVTSFFVILATIVFLITYFAIFYAIRARVTTGYSYNVGLNKRREKSFLVAFCFVIAFVICWLPSSGLRIYEKVTETTYPTVGVLLSYFVFLNSVVNPIIYFTVFRKQS